MRSITFMHQRCPSLCGSIPSYAAGVHHYTAGAVCLRHEIVDMLCSIYLLLANSICFRYAQTRYDINHAHKVSISNALTYIERRRRISKICGADLYRFCLSQTHFLLFILFSLLFKVYTPQACIIAPTVTTQHFPLKNADNYVSIK